MNIRQGDASDIEKIAELYIANWKATYKDLIQGDFLDRIDICYGIKKWDAFLKGNGQIIVAEEGPGFLGFGAFAPDPEIEDCLYIDSLHVCEEARGKGVGSTLLRVIGRYAADRNYKRMSICIIIGNDNARNLYCKLGAKHHSFFTDTFEDVRTNSEKLIWDGLKEFR